MTLCALCWRLWPTATAVRMSSVNSPNAPKMLVARHKERDVFRLRSAGKTYAEISRELKIPIGAVAKCVSRVVRRLIQETDQSAKHLRAFELARLDSWLSTLSDKIDSGDCKAIETALKIIERRHKLLGLDAPDKSAVVQVNWADLVASASVEADRLGLESTLPGTPFSLSNSTPMVRTPDGCAQGDPNVDGPSDA